jgi:tetratricopeptide (TPR) repeat protein
MPRAAWVRYRTAFCSLFCLLTQPCQAQVEPIQPFQHLHLAGTFQVHITRGDLPAYRLDGANERTRNVRIERKGETLTFDETSATNNAAPIHLYLTCQRLGQVRLEGNGNRVELTGFEREALSLLVSDGSRASVKGNIGQLTIKAEHGGGLDLMGTFGETTLSASYGSTVRLTGQGNHLRADLLEGGQCRAFGFSCKRATITARAASQANVLATESVTATADRRSAIRVKGNEAVLKKFYTTADLLLRYGNDYLQSGELAEALFYFRVGTQLFPASWRLAEGLSDAYVARNVPDSAQSWRLRAQTINPKAYATATTYRQKNYRRATVLKARNAKGEVVSSCQEYVLSVENNTLPICIGNNLPEAFRRDGETIWVRYQETKAGKLYDRGSPVVMNDCCGLIVRL